MANGAINKQLFEIESVGVKRMFSQKRPNCRIFVLATKHSQASLCRPTG